jgi:hypothetical protein
MSGNEVCLCGMKREHHINLDKWIGMEVTQALRELMAAEVRRHLLIFGNVCYNYRQDNLRYLEDESLKREGGDNNE